MVVCSVCSASPHVVSVCKMDTSYIPIDCCLLKLALPPVWLTVQITRAMIPCAHANVETREQVNTKCQPLSGVTHSSERESTQHKILSVCSLVRRDVAIVPAHVQIIFCLPFFFFCCSSASFSLTVGICVDFLLSCVHICMCYFLL